MPFANSNNSISGRAPLPNPSGSEVVAVRFEIDLLVGDVVANDIGVVGLLPAGCIPVSLAYDSDDLDANATATIVASVGIMAAADSTALSTATADGGAAWGTGITTSQAGGQSAVLSKALSRVTATQADRRIGVLFTAGAATAAAGKLGLTLMYRAA